MHSYRMTLLVLLSLLPSAPGCDYPFRGDKCEYREVQKCCSDAHPLLKGRVGAYGDQDDLVRQVAHWAPAATSPQNTIASPAFWKGSMVISIVIDSIYAINTRTQSFGMKYTLLTAWRDCRTVHNCTYMQLQSSHPEFRSFWKPELVFRELMAERMELSTSKMEIDPDGFVTYESRHVATFSCPMDFAEFPFDVQKCKLTLYIPQLPKIRLIPDPEVGADKNGLMVHVKKSGEWELGNFKTSDIELKNHPWFNYNAGAVEFTMTRYSSVQVRSYVVPTVSFWFASWCGLWIDCSAVPARAAMGVVPLLILVNKMNALAASLPPSATSNRLESYMLCIGLLLCLHLLEYAVVNFSLRRERELKAAVAAKGAESDTEDPTASQMSKRASLPTLKTLDTTGSRLDWFCARHVKWNLNVHTRWISLLLFIIFTVLVVKE